jgi:hypothetical protein
VHGFAADHSFRDSQVFERKSHRPLAAESAGLID